VLLPAMSAFFRSSPPLNFLTVQVTPLSAAHFKHRGSMAFAVFAELSAQMTRSLAPPPPEVAPVAAPELAAALPPEAAAEVLLLLELELPPQAAAASATIPIRAAM